MSKKAATAVLVLALLGGWLVTRGDEPRHLVVLTPDATGVVPGLRVRAAGVIVGSIESATVTHEHQARLVLALDDEAWPVPSDSAVELRFGGTIKYSDRYLELARGRSSSVFADGAVLPPGRFSRPVEFDRFFGTFDTTTRRDLNRFIDNGGRSLARIRSSLPDALEQTPPALEAVDAALGDLGADPQALGALVRSSEAVVDAVHRAAPGLSDAVAGAAVTFDAVADEADALRRTLAETPGTLAATRAFLARADTTLRRATTFAADAAPGIGRLRALTGPLAATLATVDRVAPDAIRTLRTVRASGPALDTFLTRTAMLLGPLGSVGRQVAKQVSCIRPYAPELAGFFSTWAGAWGDSDGKDTYLRAQFGTYPFPNTLPYDTATLTSLYPQVKMAFPRPPGDLAGRPWFQPRCGIDERAYDPAADPESR
jgi:ABC-type transporter Mla subunit MlaD